MVNAELELLSAPLIVQGIAGLALQVFEEPSTLVCHHRSTLSDSRRSRMGRLCCVTFSAAPEFVSIDDLAGDDGRPARSALTSTLTALTRCRRGLPARASSTTS
jgi:hypothetical protein